VVVGSRYLRDYLIAEGIDPNRVLVVDLLHRDLPVAQNVASHKTQPDICQLLFVGRLTYNKGVQYLLAALALLDRSFHLDIAGTGWFYPRAERLASVLGVAHRVSFLGNVVGIDLDDAYQRADLVIVPSIGSEGYGIVVGEARRRGVPVVVSDTGALPEWAAGDTGVFVAPRADAEGLADVIGRVRDHPQSSVHSPRAYSLTDALLELVDAARSRSRDRRETERPRIRFRSSGSSG
jgi:glycosyltransferase involved in cell wall biosynthesis